jgi:hypothetical protein
MKKVMLAVATIAFLGLTSCKKDYTCACTTTDSSSSTSVTQSTTVNGTKKDAKAACEKTQTVATITTTCVIK